MEMQKNILDRLKILIVSVWNDVFFYFFFFFLFLPIPAIIRPSIHIIFQKSKDFLSHFSDNRGS